MTTSLAPEISRAFFEESDDGEPHDAVLFFKARVLDEWNIGACLTRN